MKTWKGTQLKTMVILYMLVLLTSIASAEVYRWEDANGIHFTDDSSTLPERYTAKDVAEGSQQSGTMARQANSTITRQNALAANQEKQAAVRQDNLEQHRRTAEVKKQLLINSSDFDNTLQSLAKFIVIWIILGFFLFVVWAGTIVDIARSEFETNTQKTGWMLLVLFLPLFGMLFYLILGLKQKYISDSNWQQQRLKLARQLLQ
jgi:hypothetical protein